MNYERLFVLISISVFTLAATALSLLVAWSHPWLRRTIGHRGPRQRARLWMTLRFLPCITASIVTVGFGFAFIRYEPRHTAEQTGSVPLLVVALAAALVSAAAWRVGRASWNTARSHRLLTRLAEEVEIADFPLPAWRLPMDFPLAAVSGILRPRLILSSRILDECPADELAVVLRHEAAHARHYDNLTRAWLLACPDALGLSPLGNRLIAEWHHAVEEAADEEAAGADGAARVALAAALVRVGRMSTCGRPSWMPALALYDGHTLEHRVRRLLTRDPDRGVRVDRIRWGIAGALMIASAGWLATGPRLLHAFVEWGVRNLP